MHSITTVNEVYGYILMDKEIHFPYNLELIISNTLKCWFIQTSLQQLAWHEALRHLDLH